MQSDRGWPAGWPGNRAGNHRHWHRHQYHLHVFERYDADASFPARKTINVIIAIFSIILEEFVLLLLHTLSEQMQIQ